MKKFTETKRRKGFTLMEVLVASSIFAIVLVIVTGTIVQSSGYQAKLKLMSESSEEARKLADKLSVDVRSANSDITFLVESGCSLGVTKITYKSGLAIFNYDGIRACPLVSSVNPAMLAGNAVILAVGDDYKIYYFYNDSVYYGTISKTISPELNMSSIYMLSNPPSNPGIYPPPPLTNAITKEGLLSSIKFYGFAPYDQYTSINSIPMQPILKFKITVSPDLNLYPTFKPSEIQSAVTVRNYNQ